MSMNAKLEAASQFHAESMDRMYGLQRHFYDATRAYYLLGRDEMLKGLRVPENATVMEIGCGTGRNLVAAARLYPRARFFGFDISREMLRSAETSLQRARLSNSVKLAQGDAERFGAQALFGIPQFDRVYFSYTLSMIPDWQSALTQAFAAVKPGGSLHVVDFGDCARLPKTFRRLLYAWLHRFHVTPRLALETALTDLVSEYGGRVEVSRPFRSYALIARAMKS